MACGVVGLLVVAREDWVDHGLRWKWFSYRRLWKKYRAFPRFENGWIQALEGASMGFPRILYNTREPCTPAYIDAYGRAFLYWKNTYTDVSVQTAMTQPKGCGSQILDCFTVWCPAHGVVDHVQRSKVRAVERLNIVELTVSVWGAKGPVDQPCNDSSWRNRVRPVWEDGDIGG
jgi:hypothetical protein